MRTLNNIVLVLVAFGSVGSFDTDGSVSDSDGVLAFVSFGSVVVEAARMRCTAYGGSGLTNTRSAGPSCTNTIH